MSQSPKPGQKVVCTITSEPRGNARNTIERLMRLDPDHKRALKAAQEHRVRTLIVRSRGKRPWEQRVRSSKIVQPTAGTSWNMTWFPQVAPDFASVAAYVSVKPA